MHSANLEKGAHELESWINWLLLLLRLGAWAPWRRVFLASASTRPELVVEPKAAGMVRQRDSVLVLQRLDSAAANALRFAVPLRN